MGGVGGLWTELQHDGAWGGNVCAGAVREAWDGRTQEQVRCWMSWCCHSGVVPFSFHSLSLSPPPLPLSPRPGRSCPTHAWRHAFSCGCKRVIMHGSKLSRRQKAGGQSRISQYLVTWWLHVSCARWHGTSTCMHMSVCRLSICVKERNSSGKLCMLNANEHNQARSTTTFSASDCSSHVRHRAGGDIVGSKGEGEADSWECCLFPPTLTPILPIIGNPTNCVPSACIVVFNPSRPSVVVVVGFLAAARGGGRPWHLYHPQCALAQAVRCRGLRPLGSRVGVGHEQAAGPDR